MAFSKEQLGALFKMLSLTRSEEPNCDECLNKLAEFAELEMQGKPTPEALEAIEHHLELCGECREEYDALMAAISGSDPE